ncbi:MAG: sugar ABC transporter permease [Spirochaetales bacterium]|nr:sugar ABC transporter permease [Spirochaetales bacterium]
MKAGENSSRAVGVISDKMPSIRTGSLKYQKKREVITAWLFSAPSLMLLVFFLIVPFIMAFVFSLTDQRLIPNPNLPTEFIGLRNYLRLLADDTFYRAILNNFLFAIVVVPVQTAFALLLAIAVNQKLKAVKLFRTIYFSPVVITMVVVAVVWSNLFNPGQGFINQFLKFISFGRIQPLGWLTDPSYAFPAIMLLSVWQGVGFQMIIFLAGLQDIPAELYEAARVDGASRNQQFWSVTLPQLKNTTIFVVLTTTILAFKLFTQVWVLTKGGPQNSTMTTIVLLYRQGFRQLRVGYASTIAIVFFLIVLVISILQRIFLKEERR